MPRKTSQFLAITTTFGFPILKTMNFYLPPFLLFFCILRDSDTTVRSIQSTKTRQSYWTEKQRSQPAVEHCDLLWLSSSDCWKLRNRMKHCESAPYESSRSGLPDAALDCPPVTEGNVVVIQQTFCLRMASTKSISCSLLTAKQLLYRTYYQPTYSWRQLNGSGVVGHEFCFYSPATK